MQWLHLELLLAEAWDSSATYHMIWYMILICMICYDRGGLDRPSWLLYSTGLYVYSVYRCSVRCDDGRSDDVHQCVQYEHSLQAGQQARHLWSIVTYRHLKSTLSSHAADISRVGLNDCFIYRPTVHVHQSGALRQSRTTQGLFINPLACCRTYVNPYYTRPPVIFYSTAGVTTFVSH